MWNNPANNSSPRNVASPYDNLQSAGRDATTLGSGLTLKGELTGHEDVQLDCKFEGPVSFGGHRVTIGSKSVITGDIVAREAILHGKVNGDLRAHDRAEVKKGGALTGDLITGRISIEEGAYFKGHIEVDPSSKPVGADLGTLLARSEKK